MLNKRKQRGMLIVHAESIKESNHLVSFQISSINLKNKVPAYLGLCAFYGQTVFEIHRATANNRQLFIKVFRSDPQKGSASIQFKKVKIQMQQLCNSDETLPIRFRVLANELETCSGETTLQEMRERRELTLTDSKNQFAGIFKFNDLRVTENPNFAEYLRSGWQISL